MNQSNPLKTDTVIWRTTNFERVVALRVFVSMARGKLALVKCFKNPASHSKKTVKDDCAKKTEGKNKVDSNLKQIVSTLTSSFSKRIRSISNLITIKQSSGK